MTGEELVARAKAAAARAYAPYSSYLVGAAVVARDGRVFEGGPGDLEAIGITASPCGGCRQWLWEFRLDRVTFPNRAGEIVTYTPAELLPEAWDLDA